MLFKLVALAVFLRIPCLSQEPASHASFTSSTYGYSVEYPSHWVKDTTSPSDILDVVSFPLSETVHGSFLPVGGAELLVIPIDALTGHLRPADLREWIAMDNRAHTAVSTRTISERNGQGIISVTEVRGKCCSSEHENLSWIAWYCNLRGRLFKAQLTYGGPIVDDRLVPILNHAIASLKLVHSTNKPKRG